MISKTLKKQIVEKILQSSEFANSKTNKDLLTYLIKNHLDGEIPNETEIAIEILNRDKSFNSSEDPIVRVHMHKLRKKLENYYQTEGKNEKIHLEIPKGRYALKFSTVCQDPVSETKKKPYFYIAMIVVLCIICAALGYQTWSLNGKMKQHSIISKKDKIWKEFLNGSHQILFVLGNHLFFSEYSKDLKKWRYVRDTAINSKEELENFIKTYPKFYVEETNEAYFPDSGIFGMSPLLYTLYPVRNKIIFRRAMDVTPAFLREYDILFVGSIKTLGILNQIFSASNFKYHVRPNELFFTPPETPLARSDYSKKIFYTNPETLKTDTLETTFNNYTGYNRDLAVVLKVPGPMKNTIFIISSFFSSGAPEVAKYLTDKNTLEQIEQRFIEKYTYVPDYFEILFEVRGIEKTGLSTKIIYFNELVNANIW